ncbi:efflux RND transporter periplasmic adaptor subunit [Paraglaciecola sp. MB-3u-78]|uniref:efflux RND transporter periplasmic adaptor subunit n=1 Tax=Paraglaciecola sp. MB-3u-78 TaxID=2058332 RepID=UPI000C32D1B9|nr:efflux RND transporter periplasmic adaptor subunit [Paraglaciecola sp. MB-3u-78]PKG98492.1 efflux transporter periplasmic adaptor subunit [Paraglaciecola sp. MB-3u-78]
MRLSIFLYSLLFLLTLASGCSEPVKQAQQQSAPEVDVSQPIQAVITQWDEYTGRFAAVNQVQIRSRVSGYLQQTKFQDGQAVKKGDVLFVIDQRPFEIALKSAGSRFELAKKELERGKDLRNKNSLSQEEVDRRTNEYDLAWAALESAKLEMEFTEVKSPINGVVSRDYVNVGNLVTGGASGATLLTTVVSVDPIHFYFDAGERDLLKYIRLSQSDKRESSRTKSNPVQVRLQDEQEFSHLGVMDFVDNQIDPGTGTIQGRAILDNPGGFILPGIFGRMRLLSQENVSVTLVPDLIVGTDQSRKFVYVVTKENKIERKFVSLGELHTQDLRIITEGLLPDDNIIVNGIMRARPGAVVSPKQVDIASQYSY